MTNFEFDGEDLYTDEYSDGRCIRIIPDSLGAKQVSAVQCPPLMVYDREDESSEVWQTMYTTSLHFLTKTISQAHFLAIESTSRTWKIHFQAAGINLQFLQKVRQIERDSLYPQPSADENSSMSSYQGRENNYQFTFPIEMNRKIAENSVIELNRIKKVNLSK